MKKTFIEFAGHGFSGCPSLHFPGELLGDVADPHGGLHGGEAGSLLLFGACGQMLLEHGQLQCCHGVLGWPQVWKWGIQLSGQQPNGTVINCPGNHIYPNQAIGSDCLGEICYSLLTPQTLSLKCSSRIQPLWPVTILISYVCSGPMLLATLGKSPGCTTNINPIGDPHLPSVPCKPHYKQSLPSSS